MKFIINIDGGSRGNPGPGASAWVIKDAKGNLLEKDGFFFKECTNNQAEFSALKMALAAAAKLGGRRLEIKSDSQLLVHQYGGQYKIKNPDLKVLMAQIKHSASGFAKVALTHVPREQNKEADATCNEIMDKALKKPAVAAARAAGQKHAAAIKAAPVQLELFENL
jgi:ribonuclease HI